jgi:hypothetical protein
MDEFGHFDQEEGDYELQRGPAIKSGDGNTNEETRPVSTTNSSRGAASIAKENATKSRPITDTATRTNEAAVAHGQDDDLQDSDDELEFVVNAKPAPVNPFADDNSDDDADEDKDIMAHDTNSKHKGKVEDGHDDHTAVSKTVTIATQDNNDIDDVEMENDDYATVVVAGFQTNANQVTRPEESSATTTLHHTQQTNDDDDVIEEEEPTANDDDDKVNVSPQKTQQDSPLSSSSNETATIVPSMTESQLDTDEATQVINTEHVATEQAALAVDTSASTQEETPTQLESPGVENKESTVAES